jgi:hypothetical protein
MRTNMPAAATKIAGTAICSIFLSGEGTGAAEGAAGAGSLFAAGETTDGFSSPEAGKATGGLPRARFWDQQNKVIYLERLRQVIGGTAAHKVGGYVDVAEAGKNDDGHAGVDALYGRKNGTALQARKVDIREHEVRPFRLDH